MATNVRFNSYLEGLTRKQRLMACEAIEQYLTGESEQVTRITSAQDIYNANRDLCNKDEEHFVLMCLDVKNHVVKKVEIAHGALTTCIVDIRVLMREALLANAIRIVVVHNHPSGVVCPSSEDDALTQNIKAACDVMHIRLTDHVIVGNDNYYSFYESGKI